MLPLVHPDRRPLTITAGPDLAHLEPFAAGDPWGPPWATTWFRLDGTRPDGWADRRIEAVIDLGFNREPRRLPVRGPRRRMQRRRHLARPAGHPPAADELSARRLDRRRDRAARSGIQPVVPPVPAVPQGSLDTVDDVRRSTGSVAAELVVVDPDAEALAYDLEVVDGMMRTLRLDDPRRVKLLRALDQRARPPPRRRRRAPAVAAVARRRRRRRVTARSPSATRTSTPPGCGRSARPAASACGRSRRRRR